MLPEQGPQPFTMPLCCLLAACTSLPGQAATMLEEAASPNEAVHTSTSGSGALTDQTFTDVSAAEASSDEVPDFMEVPHSVHHKINCFFYLEKQLCQLPSPLCLSRLLTLKLKTTVPAPGRWWSFQPHKAFPLLVGTPGSWQSTIDPAWAAPSQPSPG
ncbi:uncharacterized protein UNQ6126/PRO20091 [Pan troglodytes]|uniref:Uncharacterized protein n=1 Tax=Pan troglodytes TaxID=9598 RepID=A0A2I3SIG1_PANTR|nr:uncharacterized protein UNQ6126/PRO20091 [Pan troglodytes]